MIQKIILADHISKSFGDKTVLRDVSLVVRPGEITGLIGLNGAGKTTLLSILAGILEADSGYLRVYGQDPIASPRESWRKERNGRIGFISNRYSNITERGSVLDSLKLCRKMYQVSEEHYHYVLDNAGMRLKFSGFAEKSRAELSLGELSKAEFLYTLMMKPHLWLMDEPSVGMDYESRKQMYEIIREIRRQNPRLCLMAATHNMQEMEILCDRVVVLYEGRDIFRGELKDLQERYTWLGTIRFELVGGNLELADMPVKQYMIEGNQVKIVYDKRYVSPAVLMKQILETAQAEHISMEDMDMETMIKSIFQ